MTRRHDPDPLGFADPTMQQISISSACRRMQRRLAQGRRADAAHLAHEMRAMVRDTLAQTALDAHGIVWATELADDLPETPELAEVAAQLRAAATDARAVSASRDALDALLDDLAMPDVDTDEIEALPWEDVAPGELGELGSMPRVQVAA